MVVSQPSEEKTSCILPLAEAIMEVRLQHSSTTSTVVC